jgi:phosphatidylglycerophosphate synthase
VTISTGVMTDRSARGATAGLVVHLGLLASLAVWAGAGALGIAVAVAYALGLHLLLTTGMRRAGLTRLGPANAVTLARAVLIGGVTALIVTSFSHPVNHPLLITLIGVALALDFVDGQVARRTGSVTELGARFDMEADSFLALMLSVLVAEQFGWWALALGVYRYLFVAASWLAPWLNGALPPKYSRKVVAAFQGVTLVVVAADLLPAAVNLTALAAAFAAVNWSFGRDILGLWRAERARRVRIARRELIPAFS